MDGNLILLYLLWFHVKFVMVSLPQLVQLVKFYKNAKVSWLRKFVLFVQAVVVTYFWNFPPKLFGTLEHFHLVKRNLKEDWHWILMLPLAWNELQNFQGKSFQIFCWEHKVFCLLWQNIRSCINNFSVHFSLGLFILCKSQQHRLRALYRVKILQYS